MDLIPTIAGNKGNNSFYWEARVFKNTSGSVIFVIRNHDSTTRNFIGGYVTIQYTKTT